MERVTLAIVFLDIVAILMTAGWILFNVARGITFLEIFYNYAYTIVIISSYILSIIKLVTKDED